jgi:transposase
MTIVGGFDVHRKQITFDYVDSETREGRSGQIRPATRRVLRAWLGKHCPDGDAEFAVEGCTGWRFVTEELTAAGARAHLADPAETAALRGPKKRAKTDRADARLLRTLLCEGRLPESAIPPTHVLEVRTLGRLPESAIPPTHVLEVRTLGRLYCALTEERRAWQQRIAAQLFHQGCPAITAVRSRAGRTSLASVELSAAGRQYVDAALPRVDELTDEIESLRTQLTGIAQHQPACQALQQRHYGIGWLLAAIIWAEIGDVRRFTSSEQLVRYARLDITVYSSDRKRAAGHLARQGSPELRWAVFEAAKCASHRSSPDYAYYQTVAARRDGKRATLAVARKLLRRIYHTLHDLGDASIAIPISDNHAA